MQEQVEPHRSGVIIEILHQNENPQEGKPFEKVQMYAKWHYLRTNYVVNYLHASKNSICWNLAIFWGNYDEDIGLSTIQYQYYKTILLQ